MYGGRRRFWAFSCVRFFLCVCVCACGGVVAACQYLCYVCWPMDLYVAKRVAGKGGSSKLSSRCLGWSIWQTPSLDVNGLERFAGAISCKNFTSSFHTSKARGR